MEARKSPFSHIIVPTDGSETSINAGQLAIQIATMYPIKITFVYVIDAKTAEEVSRTTRKPGWAAFWGPECQNEYYELTDLGLLTEYRLEACHELAA